MMYKGEHSLTFTAINAIKYYQNQGFVTTYHTWKDFHLVPTSRPVFNLPELKSEYVDIPQRDGSIDLTTKLGWGNLPRYGMRKGSWEFWLPPHLSEWPMDHQRLANAVHGLSKQIISDDDPYFYYEGRVTVNWVNGNDGNGNTITFDYTLQPFKTAVALLGRRQQWDPFCFATDYFINKWPGEATYVVDCAANEWVDFEFPSEWGHTTPHTSDSVVYSFLDRNTIKTKLFAGAVQTPFDVEVTPEADSVSTSNPGRVWIRYYNEDIHEVAGLPESRVYRNITDPDVDYTYHEDDFILSHRDKPNYMMLSVKASFACKIKILAYIRSL